LKSVQLVCLGPGGEEYKSKLAEQAKELGIGDRVHFLPPVPVAEIQKVTASADAGLVVVQRNALSYELCLPSKFFEYIFAGIPVAVSDLVELRPLVEKYGLGVCFDETSEASISKAIEDLFRRKGEFSGARWDDVRHRVAREYAWNERKNDLLRVYDRLAGRTSKVPS
jgi:glycosyltransferase involved in cell wall biosynthesis